MKTFKSILVIIALLLVNTATQAQNIFNAVLKEDLAEVKELVEKNPKLAKIKAIGKGWRLSTPLHFAANTDNTEIARYLIEKGADLNAVREDFQTPLMMAGVKVTKLLIEKGVDINYTTPDGTTAIYYAAQMGDKGVFECLLDNGAKLPELNTYGASISIEFGLRSGSIKCLEKYLQQGLNLNSENNAKMTLVHFAAESDSVELVSKLIKLGAPINKPDIYGWTPLHTAAYKGNLKIVELLILKGLDKNARTIDGKTPYLLSCEEKKTDVINYLSSIGADKSTATLPTLTGEYFGQKLHSKTPEPFVIGIPDIQKGFHSIFSFTSDGKEVYLKPIWDPQTSIQVSKMVNGQWTTPKTASFSDEDQGDDALFISPDGKKLFFLSQRPVKCNPLPFPYVEKIWVMERTKNGWSKPKKLPEIVNSTEGIHWQVSVDSIGNLYFGAGGSIYYSIYKGGEYKKPIMLDSTVNNKKVGNFSPYISPDGSYLIFSREVPYFTYQLFISYIKIDGTWSEAFNLSNYLKHEYSLNPRVTLDGKYFFFTGRCGVTYWMDAGSIEELRPKE